MQSQIISQNVSPKNEFEISPILVWNLQYSLSKLLEGIDLKALYTDCFDKDTGLPFYLKVYSLILASSANVISK